jgi:hypothetical protein
MSEALKALLAYQQADEDGVMVLTSRQAIHEVAKRYDRLLKKLTEIHEIAQDANMAAWEKIDNIAATASSALSNLPMHNLPGHDETMAVLGSLTIRPQPKSPHVLKIGNLFNAIPNDVPYHGCYDKDCLPGCNLGKGHCQRLEDAFRMAGYADV